MNSPPLRASASIIEGNLAEESGSGLKVVAMAASVVAVAVVGRW